MARRWSLALLAVALLPALLAGGPQEVLGAHQEPQHEPPQHVVRSGEHAVWRGDTRACRTAPRTPAARGRAGAPLFVVEAGGSLLLEDMELAGCSAAPIIELSEGAKLVAVRARLRPGTAGTAIRAAAGAKAELHHTRISGSGSGAGGPGLAAQQSAEVPQPCGAGPGPCDTPALRSALIDFHGASLIMKDSAIEGVTAPGSALIRVTAGAPHTLELVRTAVAGNACAWLVVADSWAADAVGRANLLAPQPSRRSQDGAIHANSAAPFTAKAFVGGVRGMPATPLEWQRPERNGWVGAAPASQAPLLVRLQGVTLRDNVVADGLAYLRLVNTSLADSTITGNRVAGTELRAGAHIDPPHPCNLRALHRGLLMVHGPSAFDMCRCNISNNVHASGAVLHVSPGLGLTSLRNSTLRGNIATAVVKFLGRTWALRPQQFLDAWQFLDVSFHTQTKGAERDAWLAWLREFDRQKGIKDASSLDASLYIHACDISDNRVFHAVLLAPGNRTLYGSYLASAAAQCTADPTSPCCQAVAGCSSAAGRAASCDVPLNSSSTAWWLINSTLDRNSFAWPSNATLQSFGVAGDRPRAGYLATLSALFSASAAQLRDMAAAGPKCTALLRTLAEHPQTSRPSWHPRMPAVMWTDFTQGLAAGSRFEGNRFGHVFRADNAYLTLLDSSWSHNSAAHSLFTAWDGDLLLRNVMFEHNTAGASVLELSGITGTYAQVRVVNNTAGATLPYIEPPQQPAVAPVWRMTTWEVGRMWDIVIAGNRGSIALDATLLALVEPLRDLVVSDNNASGVRLTSVQPRYERQGIELVRARITNNVFPADAEVGALAIGGFHSDIGISLPVRINASVIANNTAHDLQHTKVQGGGVLLPSGPDKTDDGSHGFLKNLEITITDTRIEGCTAAEGAGLWSAWPITLRNCTIRGNRARQAGGGVFLHGLQHDKLGAGASEIATSLIKGNAAAFGGGLACSNCRAQLVDTSVRGNRAERGAPGAAPARAGASKAAPGLGSGGTDVVPLLAGIVRGAGGAIAANMDAASSWLDIVGGTLAGNTATAVGVALYLNHSGAACSAWDNGCGIVLRGTPLGAGNATGNAAGAAVALAGDVSQACNLRCAPVPSPPGQPRSCGCALQLQPEHVVALPRSMMPRSLTACILHTPWWSRCRRWQPLRAGPFRLSREELDALAACGSSEKLQPVLAGDSVKIAVLLDNGVAGHHAAALPALDATVQLQQGADGLVAIGNSTAAFSHKCGLTLAIFNVSLQSYTAAPWSNQRYAFAFVPGAASDLLRDVRPTNVTVDLLRCTLGQTMSKEANRCIRCASGTFALTPREPCAPCPAGGSCTDGLLRPLAGHFSWNPFVPQLLPCLYADACAGQNADWAALQHELFGSLAAGLRGANSRALLQTAPAANGSAAAPGPQLDALLRFQQVLAQLWTEDPGAGEPQLLRLNYTALLDTWQRLQCSRGHRGFMCGACTDAQGSRHAMVLGRCVACRGGVAVAVALLFIAFVAYNLAVVIAQLRAPGQHVSVHPPSLRPGPAVTAAPPAAQPARALQALPSHVSHAGSAGGDAVVCVVRRASTPAEPADGLLSGGGRESPFAVVRACSWPHQQPATASDDGEEDEAAAQGAQPGCTAARAGTNSLAAEVSGPLASQLSVAMGSVNPARLLVGIWRILTSYIQVLVMLRFVLAQMRSDLPLAPFMAGLDLSMFSVFAFDCALPAGAGSIALWRVLWTSLGLPLLLAAAFLAIWLLAWCAHRALAALRARRAAVAGGSSFRASSSSGGMSASTRSRSRILAWWPPSRTASSRSGAVSGPSSVRLRGVSAVAASAASVVGKFLDAQLDQVPASCPPLAEYLRLRLLVSAVVLAWALFPLVTSSWLGALTCDAIQAPDAVHATAAAHWTWLASRRVPGQEPQAAQALCQMWGGAPATAPGNPAMCEVAGLFWRLDPNVRCWKGEHLPLAVFAGVALVVVGLGLPLLAATLLWRHRSQLNEFDFAQRYSFLYSGLKPRFCFWECVILIRKLAFLMAMLLLPAAPGSGAHLQLQAGIILAMLCILLQEGLRPYRVRLLNRLERTSLAAIAVSFAGVAFAAALEDRRARTAVLALLLLLNCCVVGVFLVLAAQQLWLWLGASATRVVKLGTLRALRRAKSCCPVCLKPRAAHTAGGQA